MSTARNLANDKIRAIAGTGGVIGIGLYTYAACGNTPGETVRAMRYVADRAGVQRVAVGSDFGGATTTAIDPSGFVPLTCGKGSRTVIVP